MALKRRDPVAIGGVSNYMQEASQNLISIKNKTLQDIQKMLSNYQGRDALEIGRKLIEAVQKLDSVIERFDAYSKYMLALAKHDRENIDTANKQINSVLQDVDVLDNNNMVLDNLLEETDSEISPIKFSNLPLDDNLNNNL